jgi:hypothetical protein
MIGMTTIVRFFCAAIGLIVLANVFRIQTKRKLNETNTLLWSLIGAGCLLAGIFPGIFEYIAGFIPVRNPLVFVSLGIILWLMFIVFKGSVDITVLKAESTEMAINLSIATEELRRREQRILALENKLSAEVITASEDINSRYGSFPEYADKPVETRKA